jgi:beta-N-acetylhexosaminidase
MAQDIVPFEKMIRNDLAGIMPAHVIYDRVDKRPAGYSQIWLQDILRAKLHFQGIIFSDDLSMEAAGVAGDYGQRAEQALRAGCDMVLICNHPEGVARAVDHLEGYANPATQLRLVRMHGQKRVPREELLASTEWQQASTAVSALDESPWMELDV